MSRSAPTVSRKSRPVVRAARARKPDRVLAFTKADMDRQRKASLRFLAVPTIEAGDPKVSETGIIQKRHRPEK
jgi:hypothetical protein